MKFMFKVVLILLIGMIGLNGYSSTTTHTTKKMDNIEKMKMLSDLQITSVLETQLLSVEIRDQDVGLSNYQYCNKENYYRDTGQRKSSYITLYNYTTTAEKANLITPEVPLNPPPLLG